MKPSQEKVRNASIKITVILKLGLVVSVITAISALAAIGILLFSGEDMRSSFLKAFDVTANNGTTISIAPQPLLVMFVFMLADAVLISAVIFMVHGVFDEIKKGGTPFSRCNIARIQKAAVIVVVLSVVGSYSDALVDYYTIGELTWRVHLSGLVMGMTVYCISLIFGYGCDLQQESDETL